MAETYCDVMVRANKALTNRRPEEAIRLYTQVLYKQSPAHVCALLNRSIAYLDYGYHELAVMDAYRACIAANELRKDTPVTNTRLTKVAKYIKVERQHVNADETWTRPGRRNVGVGWARSPLASAVVNATPVVTPANETPAEPFRTTRSSLGRALDIRATYRLCGSLFMLGRGARNDALGLIDDIRWRVQLKAWERRWFDKLGNEIMNTVVSEVDPQDQMALRLSCPESKDNRDERMMKLKEVMKAATTGYGYGDYPWDPYEPKLEKSSWQKRAQDWVEACSNSCSAVVIVPDGKDDTTIEGSKPYVELRANRDIYSEDLVLYVQTISNVTTSTPEQVEARRRAGILDHYYCNACASLLAVPQAYSHEFQTAGMPAEPDNPLAITIASSTTGSSQKPNHSTRDHPSTGASILKFCRPSHMVPTCSANCRKLSEDFDKGICQTTIERRIRHSHLNEFEPRTAADHKTQCLRDLIFLRLITNAINLGESPLQCDDLKFATTGPNMRGIENSEMECWSFVSHVVNPIRCLRELFKYSNRDQFSKLSQVDGWIIYTLLVKINRAMRIHKGPRYVKRFQADGTLDAAFGPWDKRWEGPPKLSKEQEDKSIWIASIDSLFNMIRIADPAKGETPNVAVIQKEGVHVYAVKADGGLAIKAGEPLLRAADGVEGPVVDERLYERGLPEWMEETEDGEELHSGDTSEFLDEFSDDDEEILGDVDDEDELGGEAMEE